jgi:hypothetical protein
MLLYTKGGELYWRNPPQESSGRTVLIVQAKENVETPAGTFECYIISTYEK